MDNQIYNLGSTPTAFMDTKHSTSNLAWIWVIETLATSNEIDTSLLIDLVKRIPEISDDVGRNARELVSLRVLETLSVQENSNAKNDASVPGDKIEFDQSVCCEDVLRHLLLGVSSDQKRLGQSCRNGIFSHLSPKKDVACQNVLCNRSRIL